MPEASSRCKRFVRGLECFTLAESLGGVESLIAHPATMTHASMDAEARAVAGISDSLLRLSVGIEGADDLVRDLVTNLDAAVVPCVAVPCDIAEAAAPEPIDIVVLGFGAIGRELLTQAGACDAWTSSGARVRALIDRSGYVADDAGFSVERLAELCEAKASGQPLREARVARGAAGAGARGDRATAVRRDAILVDATPADTTDVLSPR